MWLLSHGKWLERGWSVAGHSRAEAGAFGSCSSNEKGFSLSWLKVSKQAGTTELTLCGAVENQPEQKSEVMGEPMAALLPWIEVHWKDEHAGVTWAMPLGR